MAKQNQAPKQCSNCGTLTSSMWRRTVNKQVACNACGLYYKLYGVNRPMEMRKDIVYPRNRYSKLNGKAKPTSSAAAANGSTTRAPNNNAYSKNSLLNQQPKQQQQQQPQSSQMQKSLLGAFQNRSMLASPINQVNVPQKFILIDDKFGKKLLPFSPMSTNNVNNTVAANSAGSQNNSLLAPSNQSIPPNEPISLIKVENETVDSEKQDSDAGGKPEDSKMSDENVSEFL